MRSSALLAAVAAVLLVGAAPAAAADPVAPAGAWDLVGGSLTPSVGDVSLTRGADAHSVAVERLPGFQERSWTFSVLTTLDQPGMVLDLDDGTAGLYFRTAPRREVVWERDDGTTAGSLPVPSGDVHLVVTRVAGAGSGDPGTMRVRVGGSSGGEFSLTLAPDESRKEKRRVGKKCRSRWSPEH